MPVDELRAAVAFLTRIPVAVHGAEPVTSGAGAFPLVGIAIGAIAAVPLLLAGGAHPVLAAIAAVLAITVLDGALHLDGLADTVDALVAPAGASERARTDPRAGTGGVIAIGLVLGFEVAALAELAGRGTGTGAAALIVAGGLSRGAAPLLAVTLGRRHPSASGLGRWFGEHVSRAQVIVSTDIALVTTVVVASAAPTIAAGAAVGLVAAFASVAFVVRSRGQLDGDGYGFAIEATFALVLVAAALVA